MGTETWCPAGSVMYSPQHRTISALCRSKASRYPKYEMAAWLVTSCTLLKML